MRCILIAVCLLLVSFSAYANATGTAGDGIRPRQPWIGDLITTARPLSPTLDRQLRRLAAAPVIVYVDELPTNSVTYDGRLSFIGAAGGYVYMRVELRRLPAASAAAVLAHELQHALEVLESDVTTAAEFDALYARIGIQVPGGNGRRYDTAVAVATGAAAMRELVLAGNVLHVNLAPGGASPEAVSPFGGRSRLISKQIARDCEGDMMTSRQRRIGTALALVFGLVTATTAAAQTAPGAPTNLQTAVSGNNLNLTWGAPASGGAPTSYTLLARTAPGAVPIATIPLSAVTAFAAVAPNGTFILSLTATNASGTGPESATTSVTFPTVPAAPGPPTGLGVSVAGNTASFSWTAPASGGTPASYTLVAGTSPGFSAAIASLPVPAFPTSFTVPGVPAGTYFVRLVAQNAGGSSGPSNEVTLSVAGPSAPGAPTLTASATGSTVNVSWTPGSGGAPTSYTLSASTTPGGAPIATVPLGGTSTSFTNVPNGTYYLRLTASNSLGTSPASNQVTIILPVPPPPPPPGPIEQIGSDITNSDGNFGGSLALSANGGRMVVGARSTSNGTTRVYERSGTMWSQLGGDIMGEAAADQAGTDVDINAAGTRIAVGASRNSGAGASNGHVRVYDLVGSTWTQIGADLDGPVLNGGFGWRVALSASGSRLVVGAPHLFITNGYVQVFDLVGTTWTPVGAALTGIDSFGWDVDISSDGSTIAVSAPQVPNSVIPGTPGSVRAYRLSGGSWAQVGNVLAGITTPGTPERFGEAISLTANGSRIAIGAPVVTPGANSGHRGQVRVFDLVGSTWTQVGSSVSGTELAGVGDGFGFNLTISDDGTRFAASAVQNSRGRVYTLAGGAWVQTGADFGTTGAAARSEGIALSPDGRTVAIGFINGNPKRVSVFSITP